MGVDLQTYRQTIGRFSQPPSRVLFGLDAIHCLGGVDLINMLLIMAGVEPNPGPLRGQSSGKGRRIRVIPQRDRDLLTRFEPELTDSIWISDGELLSQLRARKAITEDDKQVIECEIGENRQVAKLLSRLRRGDEYMVSKLCYSLRAIGKGWVAKKYLPDHPKCPDWYWDEDASDDDEASAVTVRRDKVLQKERPGLMKSIKLEPLLSHLLARRALTTTEEQTIKDAKGEDAQVGVLLHTLARRPPYAIDQLVYALQASDQGYVANTYLPVPEHDDTWSDIEEPDDEGFTTKKLQKHLRENLVKIVESWGGTGVEQIGKAEYYMDQPISAQEVTHHGGSRDIPITDVQQLLEKSLEGARIVISADAGMGKSRLVKHLVQSWAEDDPKPADHTLTLGAFLRQRFDAILPIPLRLVKGRKSDPLEDVICIDANLQPPNVDKATLRNVLEQNGKRSLYLIDSYEELTSEELTNPEYEINRLIHADILREATVLITTRTSGLTELEKHLPQAQYTSAQLQDLAEKDVKQFLTEYHDEGIVQTLDMNFLGKPINLVLTKYLLSKSTTGDHWQLPVPATQTELFNRMAQYKMQVYSMKKGYRGAKFEIRSGSPFINENMPPEAKLILEKVARMCYEALRAHTQLLYPDLHHSKDFMELGFFSRGPKENSLILPHQLFQEHFGALHVVKEEKIWGELMTDIAESSEQGVPRLHLGKRGLGMENVVKFVAGLSHKHALEVARSGFLVIEKEAARGPQDPVQTNLFYPLQLINECPDRDSKEKMAVALLNARIHTDDAKHNVSNNRGSWSLLALLNKQQQMTFMEKVYGFAPTEAEHGTSVLRRTSKDTRVGMATCDSYLLEYCRMHHCEIKTGLGDLLNVRHTDLTTNFMLQNMQHVVKLLLCHCRLSIDSMETSDGQLPNSNVSNIHQSLDLLELEDVTGVNALHNVVLPSARKLCVFGCDDAELDTLSSSFPAVRVLCLSPPSILDNVHVLWPAVRTLVVALDSVTDGRRLDRAVDIFPAVTDLILYSTRLPESAVGRQWQTVDMLGLKDCENVNAAQLDMLVSLLPAVKWLLLAGTTRLQGCVDVITWHKVTILNLNKWGDVDQAEVVQLQRVFPGVSELVLEDTRLQQLSTLDQQWRTVERLVLRSSLVEMLDEQEARALLISIFPAARIEFDYRNQEDAIEAEHMKQKYAIEAERLKTYFNFPTTCPVKPEALAQTGFWYTGKGDCVQCHSCGRGVLNWGLGNDPWEEHARHYPDCSFLLSEKAEAYVQQVQEKYRKYAIETERLNTYFNFPTTCPVRPEALAQAGFCYTGDQDRVRCYSCRRDLLNWRLEHDPWDAHAHYYPDCSFLLSEKGEAYVQQVQEKHRKYAIETERLNTYFNFPTTCPVRPEALAQAGFCYTGDQDRVQCYSCRRDLLNWRLEHDPWDSHAHYYPDCSFLLSEKGEAYVQQVQEKYRKYPIEAERLKTYANFPTTCPVRPEALAQAGFWYTGKGDCVQCHSCGGGVLHWQQGDDPWESHAHHYPVCSFLLSEKGEDYVQQVQEKYCRKYAIETERLNTYFNFPTTCPVRPEALAQAGFWYTGDRDRVRCYSCRRDLLYWRLEHDPWESHARHYPDCSFLLSEKGDAYVQHVQEKYRNCKVENPQEDEEQNHTCWKVHFTSLLKWNFFQPVD